MPPAELRSAASVGIRGIVILGSTASSKTEVALDIARLLLGSGRCVDVLSADSMAVYRGMDVGTAKPSVDDRAGVPYHLIDLVDPWCDFTVVDYQCAARAVLKGSMRSGRIPLLVGGTGLYLRSVIDDLEFPGRFPEVARALGERLDRAGPAGSDDRTAGLEVLHSELAALDPEAATRIGPKNERRLVRALEVTIGSGRPFTASGPGLDVYPPIPFALVGVAFDPERSRRRIEERFTALMERGLLDEVRHLASSSQGISRTARQALGYRELLAHIEDGVPLDDACAQAIHRTQVFARRQWAWFRRDPRIEWLEGKQAVTERVVELARFVGSDP